jgi:hypothetical protein
MDIHSGATLALFIRHLAGLSSFSKLDRTGPLVAMLGSQENGAAGCSGARCALRLWLGHLGG